MPVQCHAPYHDVMGALHVAKHNVMGLTCAHMTCITAGMQVQRCALSMLAGVWRVCWLHASQMSQHGRGVGVQGLQCCLSLASTAGC